MRDLRILIWLRWRQFLDDAIYWLRVLGYRPQDASLSQTIYVIYLLGIAGFWGFAMWAWAFDQANFVGSHLTPDALAGILTTFPVIILAIQVFVLIVALRSTPLKLSFADMAYVAGSPLARSAPVLVGFIRQVALRLVLLGVFTAVFAVLIIRPVQFGAGGEASLRAILVIAPLIIMTWALAWLLGILRLIYPGLRRIRFLWVLPFLLVGLVYVVPDAVLWPGRAVILVILGYAPAWFMPFIVVLAGLMVALLFRMGDRVDMIQAADESVLYARIQALGLLAWRQPDLQFRIRMQEAQATRKPFLRLPKVTGFWVFATRAALSYVRHPTMLLMSLGWGIVMTFLAIAILKNELPVQLWIGWLLAAGIAPPAGLLHVFRTDVEERFLRQFLPVNGLHLFIADILMPFAFLIIGGLGIWLLQDFPADITTMGILFIPLLGLMLALSGGVALTSRRVLQTRILATAASFTVVAVAGVSLRSPLGALVVAIIAVFVLMGMVATDA